MRRIQFEMRAPGKDVFAPTAFDSTVGRHVRVTFGGTEEVQAEVLAVRVSDDGKVATFTLELPKLVFDFVGMS